MKMKMTAYRQTGSSPGASHSDSTRSMRSERDHTSASDRFRDRGRGLERGHDRGRDLDRGHHRSRRRGRIGVYSGALRLHLFCTCFALPLYDCSCFDNHIYVHSVLKIHFT